MSDPNQPQFLDGRSYRLKRMMDAAGLLPVLAAIAIAAPLPYLFVRGEDGGDATTVALYLFWLWLIVIGLAALLSRRLADPAKID